MCCNTLQDVARGFACVRLELKFLYGALAMTFLVFIVNKNKVLHFYIFQHFIENCLFLEDISYNTFFMGNISIILIKHKN